MKKIIELQGRYDAINARTDEDMKKALLGNPEARKRLKGELAEMSALKKEISKRLHDLTTGAVKDEGPYCVNYQNRVGSNTVKECDTFEEAKTFCDEFFKGYEKYDGGDNDRISWCRLVVYAGPLSEDEAPLEVYDTDYFWEKN